MSKAVDKAYEIIRDRILEGEISAGERLREEELTKLTGVSRTPVREALRRLEQEGFAVIQDNRGASVPVYSTKDVDEIYGLRALLEGHAARRAATRIQPAEIARLEAVNDQLKALADSDMPTDKRKLEMTRLNSEFHQIILDASDNLRLAGFVDQLTQVALSARTFARYGSDGEKRSLQSHDELIRALKSGHPDWAEATMRGHVHNARQVMTIIAEDEQDA